MRRWLLKKCMLLPALLLLVSSFPACSSQTESGVRYVIGVSQANLREPWRLVMMQQIREEAEKYGNVEIVCTDATQDSGKQISDIRRLLAYGVDLMIVSPCDTQKITPVVSEVYRSVPVIVLDRAVEGFNYSLFIGPDNHLIGKKAGEEAARLANGKSAQVLELCSESQTSRDRSSGFEESLAKRTDISVRQLVVKSESRDAAEDELLSDDKLKDVDVIFAHNDYMALGAYRAVSRRGYRNRIKIIGVDGFPGEDGGLDLVRRGLIEETITSPTGGKEAIQFSMDILNRVSGVPKQVILRSHLITAQTVEEYERGLKIRPSAVNRMITVGYVQVGTESAFRLAANRSIEDAARDEGINLITANANQSQARQIEAVRSFIEQKVDVIVISPVVESGWDEVLAEAKRAGIPVLLSDRKISVPDDSLVTSYIGADFVEEGRRAMRWLAAEEAGAVRPVRILEIKGTEGASPTTERKQGFEEVLKQSPSLVLIDSRFGNFTYDGGKQAVEQFFAGGKAAPDAIFAHNDDMALGAADALKERGIQSGADVKIISVDGTRAAFQALLNGRINCVVECSPLLGPQLMKAVKDLMAGKELPLRIITDEKVFTKDNAAAEQEGRKY